MALLGILQLRAERHLILLKSYPLLYYSRFAWATWYNCDMKILWTDGSASPNPGPGGFAVIEQDASGRGVPVVLGSEPKTTNIRMEGKAMIVAIKYAGSEGCEIHSDSEFWLNVLTKWAEKWQANGWKKKNGPILNLEIVQELYELYHAYPVKIVWVRGHVGTELNELTDEWANKARMGAKLPEM